MLNPDPLVTYGEAAAAVGKPAHWVRYQVERGRIKVAGKRGHYSVVRLREVFTVVAALEEESLATPPPSVNKGYTYPGTGYSQWSEATRQKWDDHWSGKTAQRERLAAIVDDPDEEVRRIIVVAGAPVEAVCATQEATTPAVTGSLKSRQSAAALRYLREGYGCGGSGLRKLALRLCREYGLTDFQLKSAAQAEVARMGAHDTREAREILRKEMLSEAAFDAPAPAVGERRTQP